MKVNINKLLLTILLLISTNIFSGIQNKEIDGYDLGVELSICAGDYEFASMLYKVYEQDATSKRLKELSNGWLIAGIANYYFSGLTYEISKVSSDGKRETTMTQWFAALEGANKNEDKVNIIMSDLTNKLKVCKEYEDTVVLSQKLLKQFLSEVTKK
jgi:hypothetical protein